MRNLHHSIDEAGLARLASLLLRDAQPSNAQLALEQLDAGLGAYVADKKVLSEAVRAYFAERTRH